jgi:hypothetical protein
MTRSLILGLNGKRYENDFVQVLTTMPTQRPRARD